MTDTDTLCLQLLSPLPETLLQLQVELSLRRGGHEGPEIAQIHKGGASWKDRFEIRWT